MAIIVGVLWVAARGVRGEEREAFRARALGVGSAPLILVMAAFFFPLILVMLEEARRSLPPVSASVLGQLSAALLTVPLLWQRVQRGMRV